MNLGCILQFASKASSLSSHSPHSPFLSKTSAYIRCHDSFSFRTDIFSVHGFARYIQSIVNKCLPEDKFSVRERELGTYILRKSLSPHEVQLAIVRHVDVLSPICFFFRAHHLPPKERGLENLWSVATTSLLLVMTVTRCLGRRCSSILASISAML